MRRAAVIIVATSLAVLFGCGPSYEERKAAWLAHCVQAFTPAQCDVLWSVKASADDASSQAASAASLSALGLLK